MLRIFVLTAVFLVSFTPVHASDEYEMSGPYTFVGGVRAFEQFSGGLHWDPSAAISARLGYRFMSHLSFELEFEKHSEFSVDGPATADAWTLTGNIRLIFPFGVFQPYIIAPGIGVIREHVFYRANSPVNQDDTELAVLVGVGVNAYASKYSSLVLEFSYLDGGVINYTAVTGGLEYHF